MGEAVVQETPPELQPPLPMAPNRPTNIARAKSCEAAEAVETVAEVAPEGVQYHMEAHPAVAAAEQAVAQSAIVAVAA
eukprot:6931139-Prymnesium_polylepis.1